MPVIQKYDLFQPVNEGNERRHNHNWRGMAQVETTIYLPWNR